MRIHPLAAVLLVTSIAASAAGQAAIQKPSIKSADELFKKRGNNEMAEAALKDYRTLYAETPTAEAGWRLAMADYFVGLRLRKGDEDKQRELYSEGTKAGREAAEKTPDCVQCHFWTAINMALYGQSVGPFKMLFSLNEIKEHLKKSLALDPTYAYGGAYRLLGLIEQKLPGILGGSDDRAEANFKQAIETSPDEPLNYLFMAKFLHETKSRRAEAITFLEKGLAQPTPSGDRLESVEAKRDLAELKEKYEAEIKGS